MEHVFNDAVVKMTEANRSAFESALRLNKIAVRAQGLLARQQVAAFENCLEAGTRQFKLVTEVRDPKDLVARQAEVAVELGEKLVAVAQEALDIQAQARDELTTWIEEGLEAAKAETQAVAAPAKPKTAPRARAVKKAA
jgi:hypothetical protein